MKTRHEIEPEQLESFAWEYITECVNKKKDHPTASGQIVKVSERQLPTIAYFLKIWLPMKGKPTLCRSTYYNWLRSKDPSVMDTIKNIEAMFNALAIDIVANEGKGVFYAKNKLGMTDKQESLITLDPITCKEVNEINALKITNRPQIIFADPKEIEPITGMEIL